MVQFYLKVHHLNKTTLFKKIYSILYFTKNPTVMKINDISLLFVYAKRGQVLKFKTREW